MLLSFQFEILLAALAVMIGVTYSGHSILNTLIERKKAALANKADASTDEEAEIA